MEVGHEILQPSTAAAAGLTWPQPVRHQESSSSQKCQISWQTISQCGGDDGRRKSVRKATFITWQDPACRCVWSGSEISLNYLNEDDWCVMPTRHPTLLHFYWLWNFKPGCKLCECAAAAAAAAAEECKKGLKAVNVFHSVSSDLNDFQKDKRQLKPEISSHKLLHSTHIAMKRRTETFLFPWFG